MRNFIVNFFAIRDYEEIPALMERQAMKANETGNAMYMPNDGNRDNTGRKKRKWWQFPFSKADKYNRKMMER